MKQVELKDFELLMVLGRGAFGKVYLAKLNTNPTAGLFEDAYYAIKTIRKDVLLEENKVDSTVIEMRILRDC